MSSKQIRELQKLKISSNMEAFTQAVSECTKESLKELLAAMVIANDNEELFKLLLGSFINRLVTFTSETESELSKLFPMILSISNELQNPISVLFLLLENLLQKKDEILRLKVLEILGKLRFSAANIVNLLYKENTETTVLEILQIRNDLIDDFIRESIKIDNPTVLKNLGSILPQINSKFFVNYKSFLFFFENENHYTRNCLLDIFEPLILSFKESGNIEAIHELTLLVCERLCDVNLYVRSKALSVIGNLFKQECILKDQRNMLIKESMGRIRDKTVIVRKKSINLLSQILLNHPFKDKNSLERDIDNSTDSSNIKNEKKFNSNEKMKEDFNEFVDLMEECLKIVSSLLECDLKTDLLEIASFIKISYLFRLKGSKEAIHKMLGLVFTKDRQIIVDVFKEILVHRSEILYEFIHDRAFEVILHSLDIDEKPLLKNVFNNVNLFESLYVLRQCKKSISESTGMSLLQYITDILFRSKDEEELQVNLKNYVNILCILTGIKHRIEYNHEIFSLVSKNVIKMVFYHKLAIKYTVELIYSISINPEKTIGKFLKNLCLGKSSLKILDACGNIALNQFFLLERLEKSLKNSNSQTRNSLEASEAVRKSLENMKGIDNLREKRKSLEEGRKSSLSRLSIDRTFSSRTNRLSLRFEELEDTLKDKTDEEIADFFFYLKEKEILYSKTSMLNQVIPLLIHSLKSPNLEVQVVAYSSLFKCMMISSEFFNEHKDKIAFGLSHSSSKVRNVSIIAMHDFLIFYNTSVDSNLLFDMLNDSETSKNALLVIFNLLQKSIIRIRNNGIRLVSLLFSEDLGTIIKTLISNFASNANLISVIFYETYTSELSIEHLKFLSSYIPANIQESMFLKCLKTQASIERLKCVFDNFEISEKFIQENMFREEIKQLVSQTNE